MSRSWPAGLWGWQWPSMNLEFGSGRSESLRSIHSAHSALQPRPLAASAALLRGCLERSAGVFDGHLRHQGRRFCIRASRRGVNGHIFGPVAVGLFRLAQRLVNLILDATTSSLEIVSFSEFSRLQDRPVELRRCVLTCLKLISVITFPVLAGLAFSSRQLMAVLGEKRAPAAEALTVLCAFGVTYALSKLTSPLLMARSKPHLMAAITWPINLAGAGARCPPPSFSDTLPLSISVSGCTGAARGRRKFDDASLPFLTLARIPNTDKRASAYHPAFRTCSRYCFKRVDTERDRPAFSNKAMGKLAGHVIVGGAAE